MSELYSNLALIQQSPQNANDEGERLESTILNLNKNFNNIQFKLDKFEIMTGKKLSQLDIAIVNSIDINNSLQKEVLDVYRQYKRLDEKSNELNSTVLEFQQNFSI